MDPTQSPTPQQQPHNPLSTMREGEKILFEIKRHPIGMVSTYVIFATLVGFVGAAAITAPDILTEFDRQMVAMTGLAIFLFAAVLSAVFLYIARKVYYGNRWILTSDSLTQITQTSLFSRQSSQLGMDNLEDVSVERNGIMTHLFNYGLLRSQTAGEHGKFVFYYCPTPESYAQQILMARELFEHPESTTATETGSPVPR